jgi:hypothetical protein
MASFLMKVNGNEVYLTIKKAHLISQVGSIFDLWLWSCLPLTLLYRFLLEFFNKFLEGLEQN